MSRTISLPRKPKRDDALPPLESSIVRAIREAFGAMPDVTCWRNNTGRLPDRNGTPVAYGLCEGSADLVGIVQCRVTTDAGGAWYVGRFFALECKSPGRKPTEAQERFLDVVRRAGGAAGWVDNVADAIAFVERARTMA